MNEFPVTSQAFSRRRLLRKGGEIVSVALLASSGIRPAGAQEQQAEPVDPSSQLAQALNYVENAENAEGREDANAYCHNCRFWQAEGSPDRGPCELFNGMLVTAEGWCASWIEQPQ